MIYEKDCYGYEISKEIAGRTGNKFQIKEATLYAVFQRLEKKEFIKSYLGSESNGGRRRYYSITAAGRAYLRKEIENWYSARDIPDSRHKSEIIQEISRDLSEKADDLVARGKTEDEAVQMTIEDFGDDVEEIKKELMGSEQFLKNKNLGLSFAFSVWGSSIISALFIFINLYYTPHVIWFPFPVFAVAWWPIAMFFKWLRQKNKEG